MTIFTAGDERVLWTLPNILTYLRFVAAPAVPMAYGIAERDTANWLAFGIFVAAAVTDYLDGYLARRLGQYSDFGKMLDPIADKAMVGCALFGVAFSYGPYWSFIAPASIILLRESLIPGLREYFADKPVNLSVTRLAKWKTTAQMTAISAMMFHAALNGPQEGRTFDPTLLIGLGLMWLAAILTAITGWDYLSKGAVWILEQERLRKKGQG